MTIYCICSIEPAGGAAERHEGRCDAATGHAVPSPAHRRSPADVGEEHPQPTGQQGHRDAHAPGQQPVSNPRTFIRTHANAGRAALTFCPGKEKAEPFVPLCSFPPHFLIFDVFLAAGLQNNVSPSVQPIPPGPYTTPQNYGAPFTPAPPSALHMGGANYSQMPPGSFISGQFSEPRLLI